MDPYIAYGQSDAYGRIQPEPYITLRREKDSAEDVFLDICGQHQLDVIRDTNTGVVFVRRKDHDLNFVKPEIYVNDTNVIPLIQFEDVPISAGLENLAKQVPFKLTYNPRIDDKPWVSLRWTKITPAKAFAALCQNYDLEVVKYPVSGVVEVKPAD